MNRVNGTHGFQSLSARRAWIEIGYFKRRLSDRRVALRKESVDRNHDGMLKYRDAEVALRKESVDRNLLTAGDVTAPSASLSARRAWIEINNVETAAKASLVALRKESVDRNNICPGSWILAPGRSPQGERG